MTLEEKTQEDLTRQAQIMADRNIAVFANTEDVKHEESIYAPGPQKVVGAGTQQAIQVAQTEQEALLYSGLIYPRMERPAEPSLETDKVDFADILEQLEIKLQAKGMNLRSNGVFVNL